MRPSLTKTPRARFASTSDGIVQIPLQAIEDALDAQSDSESSFSDPLVPEKTLFAHVPVEKLLSSIGARPDAPKRTSMATTLAQTWIKTKGRASLALGDCALCPMDESGCALTFRGKNVFFVGSEMRIGQLCAPGRPSGALVLVLNVVLERLGFARYSVCPSGAAELLLLDAKNPDRRVSLDVERRIEVDGAGAQRRALVRQQTRMAIDRQNGGIDRQSSGTTLLLALEKAEKTAAVVKEAILAPSKREWLVDHPEFKHVAWYWLRRTLLNVICNDCSKGTSTLVDKCTSVTDVVRYCRLWLAVRVEKETNASERDFRPKTHLVQSDARVTYALDKAFVPKSKAMKIKVPFISLLRDVQRHWQMLRGPALGTMPAPPLDDVIVEGNGAADDRVTLTGSGRRRKPGFSSVTKAKIADRRHSSTHQHREKPPEPAGPPPIPEEPGKGSKRRQAAPAATLDSPTPTAPRKRSEPPPRLDGRQMTRSDFILDSVVAPTMFGTGDDDESNSSFGSSEEGDALIHSLSTLV